jgi:ribosomal protein S18 acetylase RimI-like enzyme
VKVLGTIDDTVIVRQATESDFPSLVELWKELVDFHAERDPIFRPSESGEERYTEMLSGHCSSRMSCILVAEEDGVLLAYCLIKLSDTLPVFASQRFGEVLDLAVAKQHRRRGIGEFLFHLAKKWFEQIGGVKRIQLCVATTNEVASAFWETMGFKVYSENRYLEI